MAVSKTHLSNTAWTDNNKGLDIVGYCLFLRALFTLFIEETKVVLRELEHIVRFVQEETRHVIVQDLPDLWVGLDVGVVVLHDIFLDVNVVVSEHGIEAGFVLVLAFRQFWDILLHFTFYP